MILNLNSVIKTAGNTAKGIAGNAGLIIKAHAPEILVGSGLVGFGVTIYSACKATSKAHDILAEKEESMAELNEQLARNDGYTLSMAARDEKAINKQTRNGLIKAYLPTASMGIGSAALILCGFGILNGRYVGVTMAYKTLESGYNHYRENVISEFGEETDRRMLYSIKKEEMEAALREREDNRDSKADKKHGPRKGRKPATKYRNIYSNIFDNYSDRWKRYWTPDMVLDYLNQKEREFNDKLEINGSVFVNEINDALGFERTAEGAVTGWIKRKSLNKPGKKRISLGIDEMPEEELREILSCTRNEDIRVKIRMNPDGVIYDLVDKKDYDIEAMIH